MDFVRVVVAEGGDEDGEVGWDGGVGAVKEEDGEEDVESDGDEEDAAFEGGGVGVDVGDVDVGGGEG